jgi:putative hydrolase of HD superfamily
MRTKEHLDIAELLFEFGTLRRLLRMHQQMLLLFDPTDNIASHTARTAFIGLIIAQHEDLDVGKVVAMCLLHDLAEARGNDHNWVHKRYVKVHEDEITAEQLGEPVFDGLRALKEEYEERKTPEAKAAKDADLIDELLLVKEHTQSGNREAAHWLSDDGGKDRKAERLRKMNLSFSRDLAETIYETSPAHWWKGLWTDKNR